MLYFVAQNSYIFSMESKKKFNVVFLCTDNFGRSVIAEYCLRDYLEKHNIKNIEVSSAGTNARSDTTDFSVTHYPEMKKLGINADKHIRKQFDQAMANKSDLVICMADEHKKWLKDNFNIDAPLFNELAKQESTSIKVSETRKNLTLDERMIAITHYIHGITPDLVSNIKKLIN